MLALATFPASAVAPHDDAAFHRCIAGLQKSAAAKGVDGASFKRLTTNIEPGWDVLERLDYQPEFKTPIWDYLAALVDAERIEDGRAALAKWRSVLTRASERYGVDAETIVAVWGVESNFGQNFGQRPLLSSLGVLACSGRRQKYFRGEFIAALQIAASGDVAVEDLRGSWAGAFGHTQFMPSTFLSTAVDFDGDQRRDLVGSVPDALASTANFLRKAGWRSGQPWGFEVRLPAGWKKSDSGRRNKKSLAHWRALGVTKIDGAPLPAINSKAAVLLPAGSKGPAFIVLRNFDAIYRYNAAESYALAIALLSDQLRGKQGLQTPWPTDDIALSRAERRELQRALLKRGFDIGEVDGLLGSKSREAIRQIQPQAGLPATGQAGQKLLHWLRAQASGTSEAAP